MPTPLNFAAAAQTALDNILQNALPVLLPAIMLLVIAITAVLLFLYLFGFKLGLSEKFKERLRRKKEARRGKFPLVIRRRDTGIKADAKIPWTDPASWVETNEDMLFSVEQLDADLDFFKSLSDKQIEILEYRDKFEHYDPAGVGDVAFIDDLEVELERDFNIHAKSVSNYWRQSFPHLRNIDGLSSASNVDAEIKRVIYLHAAKLSKMKQQAIAEDHFEWAKHYGDYMVS